LTFSRRPLIHEDNIVARAPQNLMLRENVSMKKAAKKPAKKKAAPKKKK
jgi:hypothetical protein